MNHRDYESYHQQKQQKRRWRVDFKELAYEGGGSASWTQYYRTKIGALFSRFWNLHISSFGGKADLIDTARTEVKQ